MIKKEIASVKIVVATKCKTKMPQITSYRINE